MSIVVFNYTTWSTRYPELATYVDSSLASLYFTEACLYCDNTDGSPITDGSAGGQRELLLNMMTAHIAQLNAPLGSESSPLVGRISSANQGSVSVQTENNYPPGTVQWYQQTKYGAAFWNATKRFRRFMYRQGPRRDLDPYNPYPKLGL